MSEIRGIKSATANHDGLFLKASMMRRCTELLLELVDPSRARLATRRSSLTEYAGLRREMNEAVRFEGSYAGPGWVADLITAPNCRRDAGLKNDRVGGQPIHFSRQSGRPAGSAPRGTGPHRDFVRVRGRGGAQADRQVDQSWGGAGDAWSR
jgi:hypothetical protein